VDGFLTRYANDGNTDPCLAQHLVCTHKQYQSHKVKTEFQSQLQTAVPL